jgi:hypothetical protein
MVATREVVDTMREVTAGATRETFAVVVAFIFLASAATPALFFASTASTNLAYFCA